MAIRSGNEPTSPHPCYRETGPAGVKNTTRPESGGQERSVREPMHTPSETAQPAQKARRRGGAKVVSPSEAPFLG